MTSWGGPPGPLNMNIWTGSVKTPQIFTAVKVSGSVSDWEKKTEMSSSAGSGPETTEPLVLVWEQNRASCRGFEPDKKSSRTSGCSSSQSLQDLTCLLRSRTHPQDRKTPGPGSVQTRRRPPIPPDPPSPALMTDGRVRYRVPPRSSRGSAPLHAGSQNPETARGAPFTIKGVVSSGGTELWANQRAESTIQIKLLPLKRLNFNHLPQIHSFCFIHV